VPRYRHSSSRTVARNAALGLRRRIVVGPQLIEPRRLRQLAAVYANIQLTASTRADIRRTARERLETIGERSGVEVARAQHAVATNASISANCCVASGAKPR
jgi:hypothetical protein